VLADFDQGTPARLKTPGLLIAIEPNTAQKGDGMVRR